MPYLKEDERRPPDGVRCMEVTGEWTGMWVTVVLPYHSQRL